MRDTENFLVTWRGFKPFKGLYQDVDAIDAAVVAIPHGAKGAVVRVDVVFNKLVPSAEVACQKVPTEQVKKEYVVPAGTILKLLINAVEQLFNFVLSEVIRTYRSTRRNVQDI